MRKRTDYTFEGTTGYTYVAKAYGCSDIKFEIHFKQSGSEDIDTVHFTVGPCESRSLFRSLTRSMIDSDKEAGLEALQSIVNEFQDKLTEFTDSEE